MFLLDRPNYPNKKVYPYLLVLSFFFASFPPRFEYLYACFLVLFDEGFRTLWSVFYQDSMESFTACNILYGCMYAKSTVSFLAFFAFGMVFSVSGKDYSPLEMYLFRTILYVNFLNSISS